MGKHTYIVVFKRNDNDVELFYQELESLVSRKIKKQSLSKGAYAETQTRLQRKSLLVLFYPNE